MGRRDEEFEDDEEFMDDEDGQEDSLSGALAQQWGAAPWYVSSFGIHVVVFLIMLIFAPPPRQKEDPPIVVQTTLAEPPEDEPEDEEDPPEIPDPQDVTEIDIVLDPQVQAEVDIEVEVTEEAVEDPVEGDPSEFDTMSDDIHSPALMGIGAVGGAGGSGGKFGSRTGRGKGRALRRGGGAGTEDALMAALRWLAHHQDPSGRWDCARYEGGNYDHAVTGLATLAFLANGHTPGMGEFRETVAKAVNWIDSQFGLDTPGHYGRYNYEAAFTLMAMAEAYGMSSGGGSEPWQRNVQAAVNAAVAAQGSNGGWRYHPGAGGDLSVSGWWMMALKSAKEAGLNVPDSTFERAKQYWTDSALRIRSDGYERYEGKYTPSGSKTTPICTAALMCGRQFLGFPQHDPIITGAADQLLSESPIGPQPDRYTNFLPGRRTGQGPSSQNFYLWYYQALGFFQLGVNSPYWQEFNPLMKKELLETQRKDGTVAEFRGSWDNNDGANYGGGGGAWGRVGQTAVGALMLSVYYRYASVHQSRGRR